MKPIVFVLGASALDVARRIASDIDAELHGPHGLVVDQVYTHATTHLADMFKSGRPIVALCASGIVIRALALSLHDKTVEPAVVAVSEDGQSIVPLLGGHHGANDLARRIAGVTKGHAAITTASEVRLGIALDEPPIGYALANVHAVKATTAQLLLGHKLKMEGDAPWLSPICDEEGSIPARVSVQVPPDEVLTYHPASLVVGVGCERGTPAADIRLLIDQTLAEHGLAHKSIAHYASLDLKEDEPGISDLGHVRYFTHKELNAESHRVIRPSEIVLAEVGTPSVAEAAALAAAGPDAVLIVPKTKSKRATCAVAQSPSPILEPRGRPAGLLSVVGLGPGTPDMRSPEATVTLQNATDWVGYDLYLDLAMDAYREQVLHKFPLGGEEDRVKHAITLAKQGKRVALICSGDAGIYAMAALAFEMLDFDRCRISVEVIAGISAFQAAAARTGGLIGHDFCAISLSDLLTPWDVILKRVQAAAEADFVIAFYNPRSRNRNDHLMRAIAMLKPYRRHETPIVISRNLGRPDETTSIVQISEFDPSMVDMLTVVLVGSSRSVAYKRSDGRTYVYTPRGYLDGTENRVSA